jgi:hypothetical protein
VTNEGGHADPADSDPVEVERGLLLLALQAEAARPDGQGWVKRRVERLEFLDTRAVRWRVSVDFVVPRQAPVVGDDIRPLWLVPITTLPKGQLVAFELRDEHGAAMWLPTAEETSHRLAPALVVVARTVLRELGLELPDRLAADLRVIVKSPPEQHAEEYKPFAVAAALIDKTQRQAELARASARVRTVGSWHFRARWAASRDWAHAQDELVRALELMRTAAQMPGEVTQSVQEVADALMADPGFRSQLEELSKNFVVHVAMASKPGVRRIINLTSERSVTWSRDSMWHRLGQSLGWRCWPVDVLIGGRGGGHHLEVAAPAGVDVVRMTAIPTDHGVSGAPPVSARGFSPHVHIRAPGSWPVRYRATIFVRIRRTGWLTASLLVAAVIALVMVFGRLNLTVLFGGSAGAAPGDAGTAATLLLALLGVIATWLVRPGEHPLAARLLRLVRLLILLDVADVLVGTGDLVLHRTTNGPPTALWSVLAWIAGAIAIMVALSWLMPRQLPRNWLPRNWGRSDLPGILRTRQGSDT